ncbi:MAG TPA: rhodanese-like domain-containing protein [Burkholderiaceae bacterium]|nr:rhodanese-like domain-containing protein [Burkholderiaceae bacterium]
MNPSQGLEALSSSQGETPVLDALDAHAGSLFAKATARRTQLELQYAGAVTPPEAWRLAASGHAVIIDVRTHAEWSYVGRVPDVALIPWRTYPDNQPNPRFLEQLAAHVAQTQPVLFLCRSGLRSHAAAQAAASAGWRSAFNILEGFEGDLDEANQRGRRNGWRLHGLPWLQG